MVTWDSCRSNRLEISEYILSIDSNAIADFVDYANKRLAIRAPVCQHPHPLSEERVRNQVSSGLVGKTIPEKRCIGPAILHNNVLTYCLEISRVPPEC